MHPAHEVLSVIQAKRPRRKSVDPRTPQPEAGRIIDKRSSHCQRCEIIGFRAWNAALIPGVIHDMF
jgi:hypothetical protein